MGFVEYAFACFNLYIASCSLSGYFYKKTRFCTRGAGTLLNYPLSVFLVTNIFISAKYDFSKKGIFNSLIKYINDVK